MNLNYIIRVTKVEKEYLKSFTEDDFVKHHESDRLLKVILNVAYEDYNKAATLCNIPFKQLTLKDIIIFLETGDPYIETFKSE
jgi:hypothetical protein